MDIVSLNKKNLKNFIILLLAKNGSLPPRRLFKVAKVSGFNISYQAVFKATSELVDNGVLVKREKEYILNKKWIKSLEHFTDLIKRNYIKEKKGDIIKWSTTQFIKKVGPKILKYVRKNKCCIITKKSDKIPLSPHEYVVQELVSYLVKHGKDANSLEVSEYFLNVPKEVVEKRKIIIVGFTAISGRTPKRIFKTLSSLKNKYDIKGIKIAIVYDWADIASPGWSYESKVIWKSKPF